MLSIQRIAVVGAGMMGAEIALSFAWCGAGILLKDVTLDLATAGKKRLEGTIKKWEEKGRIEKGGAEEALERITPQENYAGFDQVGLVVEAVVEDKEIKSRVFKELEETCSEHCIFASNTSSISISELAANTSRPDRFIGMHFFSPASVMKLVEVIPGLDTSEETVNKITDLVREISKEPVRVKDCAGFVVNRLLFALFNESWRLVSEDIATPEDIDKAVKLGLGHPVGIFQLQDIGGLDLALAVSRVLYEEYGERFKPSPVLKRKVAANHLGRKTKKGWFAYEK
jgi:3-hydroxybutyryl-CoA dehydrogenase